MKLFSLFFILLFIFFVTPVYGQGINLNVTAVIGHPINIFGYTSPFANVEVYGSQVLEKTQSDKEGYFEFKSVYYSLHTKELCLTSVDRNNRISTPLCIPTPPFTSKSQVIGPVLIPPTLSVDKGSFFTSEYPWGKGESIPNTQIDISLFRNNLFEETISQVYASTVPKYTIKTDQNGYFSFNLPSRGNSIFRVFAQTLYKNSTSPKSNTLTFKVVSLAYFIRLVLLILLAVAAVFLLIRKIKKRKTTKALVISQNSLQLYSKGKELVNY